MAADNPSPALSRSRSSCITNTIAPCSTSEHLSPSCVTGKVGSRRQGILATQVHEAHFIGARGADRPGVAICSWQHRGRRPCAAPARGNGSSLGTQCHGAGAYHVLLPPPGRRHHLVALLQALGGWLYPKRQDLGSSSNSGGNTPALAAYWCGGTPAASPVGPH